MPPHPCVFVNEPKLLDLKMILIQKHGLRAEFVGGVLNIEDTVAIKRVRLLSFFHWSHNSFRSFRMKPVKLLSKVLYPTPTTKFDESSTINMLFCNNCLYVSI